MAEQFIYNGETMDGGKYAPTLKRGQKVVKTDTVTTMRGGVYVRPVNGSGTWKYLVSERQLHPVPPLDATPPAMTTVQAQAAAKQLEADMLKLIGDFESATKCSVSNIRLSTVRVTAFGSPERGLISDLKIEVTL